MPAELPDKIAEEAQKLAVDRLVKLYELDTTALGGQYYRFVSSVDATMVVSSLTSVGLAATCTTVNPHALMTGDSVRISGAIETNYNGDFFVTVVDPDTFTFTLGSGGASPATGDIFVTRLNNTMRFGGNDYAPVAFEAIGFEWNGQGSMPTPKIRVSQVNKILTGAVIALDDLVGATFIRIRTFRKHLDDGSDPDDTAIFPKEIYRINRKAMQNKVFLEFELAASIDQEGVMLPGRQCLKTVCTHRYRIWDPDTETFDYTNATCPYTGSTYFDKKDMNIVDPSLDQCAKHLSSCALRFGNDPLPTRAFPGIGGR